MVWNIFDNNLSNNLSYDEDLEKRKRERSPDYYPDMFTGGYQDTMGILGNPFGWGTKPIDPARRGQVPNISDYTPVKENVYEYLTVDDKGKETWKIGNPGDTFLAGRKWRAGKPKIIATDTAGYIQGSQDKTILPHDEATVTIHPKLEMGGFLQSSVLPEYGSSTTKIQNVYDETTGKMIPKKVTVYDPNLPDYALGGVGRRETDLVGFEYGDTNAQFKKDFAKKIKDGEQIKLSTKDFEKYLTPTKLKKLSDANLYNEKEISHNIKDATKYTGILGTGDAGGIFPSSEVEQYLTGLRKGKVVEDAAIKKAATKGSFAADFAPMLGNALMIYGLLNEKPLVPASAPQGGSGTQVATQNLYDRERYKYGLL